MAHPAALSFYQVPQQPMQQQVQGPAQQPFHFASEGSRESGPGLLSLLLSAEGEGAFRNRAQSEDTACTHEQLLKRLKAPKAFAASMTSSSTPIATSRVGTSNGGQHCLHCKSAAHTWGQCKAVCLQCTSHHPCRRCPELPVSSYLPGGFMTDGLKLSGNADGDRVGSDLHSDSPMEGMDGGVPVNMSALTVMSAPGEGAAPVEAGGRWAQASRYVPSGINASTSDLPIKSELTEPGFQVQSAPIPPSRFGAPNTHPFGAFFEGKVGGDSYSNLRLYGGFNADRARADSNCQSMHSDNFHADRVVMNQVSMNEVPQADVMDLVVSQQFEGINPARAAMIAVAQEESVVKPSAPNARLPPRKTNSNMLPLGRPNRLGNVGGISKSASRRQNGRPTTRDPARIESGLNRLTDFNGLTGLGGQAGHSNIAGTVALFNDLSLNVQPPSHSVEVFDTRDTQVWAQLESHIRGVVKESTDRLKKKNNGADGKKVNSVLCAALQTLKPLIRRPYQKVIASGSWQPQMAQK